MSIDRNIIMHSMEMCIKRARLYMSASPQELEKAEKCMSEVRAIHATLLIFDTRLDQDTLAYLNDVD